MIGPMSSAPEDQTEVNISSSERVGKRWPDALVSKPRCDVRLPEVCVPSRHPHDRRPAPSFRDRPPSRTLLWVNRYFHSQTVAVVFPLASTSYSKTPNVPTKWENPPDVFWK